MAQEKVLIVEDTPVNMQLACLLLKVAGFEVLQAETAEAGIDLARTQLPDIILMDISLPGMDGLTAIHNLKQDSGTRHIPIVALTAHAMKGDESRALAAGSNGYITKPIDTRAFARTVAGFIENANQHDMRRIDE